jgi:hypothetical protein
MGDQVGIVTFTGKVGDVVGFKKKKGKPGIRKRPKKVAIEIRQNAPQYEETRKNEGEFGKATRGGQLFRQAMIHITKRWTDMDYTPAVMQAMIRTLRADTEHIKGEKTINFGLKDAASQMMFRRLKIYQKKSYEHFSSSLWMETSDPQVWQLNRKALWRKKNDGNLKTIKIGFLHIDFDQKMAAYEDGFSITSKRNEHIDFSKHSFLPTNEIKAPWTFVIMQVWRDGPISEPTGMLFMNVMQVVHNSAYGPFCVSDTIENGSHRAGEQGKQGGTKQHKKVWDENGVHWDVFLDIHFGEGFDQWKLGEDVVEQASNCEEPSDIHTDENEIAGQFSSSNDCCIEKINEGVHSDETGGEDVEIGGNVLEMSCLDVDEEIQVCTKEPNELIENRNIISRNPYLEYSHLNKNALLVLAIFLSSSLFGQTEFGTNNNGLIYNAYTLEKLKRIADSLQLKFKVCDFDKVFHSKLQTIGHKIMLDTNDVKQAKIDMENNISFENFILKYPDAIVDKNVLVVKYSYQDYDEKEVVEFSEVSLNNDYGLEISQDNVLDFYHKPLKNTWVFSYQEPSEYMDESLSAFYFPEDFKSTALETKYSRQIGYADCLIDTVVTKLKDDKTEGWIEMPENWQSLSSKNKEKLLDDMRSTEVIGFCSQDSRPREHAFNIALLSAETANWEVFLKAHLDIMNDRFDRMSDGSYAYGERKTYIKELEELNIDIIDLLIGISLRVENAATNHYYGNIGRLGRAISESKNHHRFKEQILSMLEDRGLDDYNRMVSYFLFMSYHNHIENKDEKKENLKLLAQSIQTLPDYLKGRIHLE